MRLGIDLGTTFSLIARVDAHGTPVLFPDMHESERFKTPSVVHIGADGALVGQAVEELLDDNPALPVARYVKLKMGTATPAFTDHRGRAWPAEAISALILKKLVRDVSAHTDEPIEGVTLTVPAHFADPQRQATLDAASLAGLTNVELIEEPLAAAVHYGAHASDPGRTILVYDLGGGTFDATVLRVAAEGLDALATDGVPELGGRDFDEAIVTFIADQFRATHNVDPRQDPASSAQLRRQAEAIKIKLALPGKGEVRLSLMLCGKTLEIVLTRGQFDRLTAGLVSKTLEVCERTLRSAGIDWNGIDQIVLAGGSTLLPSVDAALRRASDKPGERVKRHQPHMAIAYGAAMIAAQRDGQVVGRARPLRQRIAGAELGFRVFDPATRQAAVDTLIARNTPIPASKTTIYYSHHDAQSRMVFEVVQVREPGVPTTSLGQFAFLLDAPRRNHPLEVTLGYDREGMARVSVRDPATGRAMQRDLTGPGPQGERIALAGSLLASTRLCE